MLTHTLPGKLLDRQIKVVLVGAGGSGSQMLTGLAQLHHSMLALGHPGGLHVTVVDDDTVSRANIGRQLFYAADIGRHKAEVLVQRINLAMGCNWTAVVERISDKSIIKADIVIGCVDTRKARAAINRAGQAGTAIYWLDLGNRQKDGQAILGQFPFSNENSIRLPTVADLFPEACDPEQDGQDDGPSCSLAEALEKQSLFVNRGVTLFALNMLFELFRYGKLDYSGVFVNLKDAKTNPLPIDPKAWKDRFGYETGIVETEKKVA